ncbi:MAG: hypothetical protein O7A06_05335 [Acidobacteria bacterium]|nr:hypothetical protein [Acidobacteriota bacterium]
MATKARATFQKRQKELARKEKRQMKEERRVQRKLAHEGGAMSEEAISPSDSELEPGSNSELKPDSELEPESGSQAT